MVPAIPDELFTMLCVEIRRVLDDSEAATLTVGSNLSDIVGKAEQYVDQLQESVGAIGASGEGGISHTLDQQSASTDEFVHDLGVVIADNSDVADRVIEATGGVSDAARSVADVASQARMLCFNTKIEAGRLGDLGRPFMVIADKMRELSEAIAESNDLITQLTSNLTPLLHEVKSSVRSLQGRTAEFTVQNDEQRSAIQSMSRRLQEGTAETIQVGDRTLADIIERSGDSIVALQTQDIISQRLRKILTAVRSARGDSVDGRDECADVGFLSDHLAPSDDSMTAGEMELF